MAKPRKVVILLRGVNVGGSGRIRMVDLRAAVAAAGYPECETYLQTGNVLLTSAHTALRIADAVETAVRTEFGFATHAMVRTADELTALTDSRAVSDPTKTAFGFCKTRPRAAAAAALASKEFGRDHATVAGSDLVLFYADGLGRSKMSGAVIERVLGVPVTVRNWNVTTALARLLQG